MQLASRSACNTCPVAAPFIQPSIQPLQQAASKPFISMHAHNITPPPSRDIDRDVITPGNVDRDVKDGGGGPAVAKQSRKMIKV